MFPPLNFPSTTSLIASKTAVSTRFTALVRMCGPRKDWSASTPIPQTPFSFAASSAPSPQPPATWKIAPAPCSIWFSAICLHFAWSAKSSRVVVQHLDPRIGGLRARLVAGDEAVDRRLLLAADRADHVLGRGRRFSSSAGEVADEVARLLLLEEETREGSPACAAPPSGRRRRSRSSTSGSWSPPCRWPSPR